MPKDKVIKLVKAFAEILKKNGFVFSKIYLFGSYAQGIPTKDSDIDVAVVVNKAPRGRELFDKETRLWILAPEADTRIEPILLEENDMSEKDPSIMGYEVLKHGILIA